MQKAALYTSSVFFTAAAIAHLLRLTVGIDIVVEGAVVPVWVSFPGVLAAALLAIRMLVAARRA